MREIKFRAWCTVNKRMIYNPYKFDPTPEYILNGAYPTEWKTRYILYEFWRDVDDGIGRPCHIMQYTGLKDRLGVDIYEGDILKDLEEQATYKVIWDDDRASFDFYRVEDGEYMSTYYEIKDIAITSKLIGNVIEHSHLLNK